MYQRCLEEWYGLQDTPVLVDVSDSTRAFARVKEWLVWFCRRAADSASVLVRVSFNYRPC
jgi:hypothetical protein